MNSKESLHLNKASSNASPSQIVLDSHTQSGEAMEREEEKKLSLRGSYELLQEEENEFIFSSFLPFF